MPESQILIFGVRHHGPGSSRSVLAALTEFNPDCVLIEGPPDANEMIRFVDRTEMTPPVALLVHSVESPRDAVYYPMAEFSPEWQAMRWALSKDVPARFMDLPQWHRLPIEAARREKFLAALAAAKAAAEQQTGADADAPQPGGTGTPAARPAGAAPDPSAPPPASPDATDSLFDIDPSLLDPLGELARAAGFDDGERWWEHVVEHRRDGGIGMFAAIKDAMAELRQSRPPTKPDSDEILREAWMRRTIREARKEGFARIAVVCGAWHAPALDIDAMPKKQDDALLGGLPKTRTTATWVPWTYERLTYASGYGAGVASPGWYDHLWRRSGHIIESWMTRVAGLLREKDIDCSSAHVIEAVRLSATLAMLRARPLADLSDIADATRSVFCFESDLPMRLIARDLLIGDRMGELPDDVPMVPLQQDLQRLQKSLRLKPEALEKSLELDLRNETDRLRSHLLHRLRLLAIDWGVPVKQASGKGTFKESWTLRWQPEYAVKLIEAGVLGTTIESAAAAKLRQLAEASNDLRELCGFLSNAMLAELGEAVTALVRQIQAIAAVAADVTHLMQALPQLANLLRYGNVRQTDSALVADIVGGIVPRITAGLGPAVASLNDDAAAAMLFNLSGTHDAIEMLENQAIFADWFDALRRVLDSPTVHGVIRGKSGRLLLDAGKVHVDDIASRLSQTLSRGGDPADGARWLEGFLTASGLLLIHDEKLLGLIDAWVQQIDPAIFQELLPLLRRTFATFPPAERRQIGQRLSARKKAGGSSANVLQQLDRARAERALPLLRMILLGEKEPHP